MKLFIFRLLFIHYLSFLVPSLFADSDFVWYRKPGIASPPKQTQKIAEPLAPDIRSFVSNYCIKCHGPDKQKGGVRLDELPKQVKSLTELEKWHDVLDVLNSGTMPPEKSKQPNANSLVETLEDITKFIEDGRLYIGSTENRNIRRLNQREYRNTIVDLLGVELPISSIPEDNTIGDYDTNADSLTISAPQLEAYLELGKQALDLAIKPVNNVKQSKKPKRSVSEGEKLIEKTWKKRLEWIQRDMPKYQRFQVLVEQQMKWPEIAKKLKIPDETIAKRTYNELRRNTVNSPWNYYGDFSLSETGALLIPLGYPHKMDELIYRGLRDRPPGFYTIQIHCGIIKDDGKYPLYLKLSRGTRVDNKEIIGRVEITKKAPYNEPIIFKVYHDGVNANSHYMIDIEQKLPRVAQNPMEEKLGEDNVYGLWLDKIEQFGPIEDDEFTSGAQVLFGDIDPYNFSDNDVSGILTNFARLAFRGRRVSSNYISDLVDLYHWQLENTKVKHGYDKLAAIKVSLSVILSSPSFIYLAEDKTDGWISDRDLAVRLSYFLWGGPPTAEVWEWVAQGDLNKPANLVKIVDQMMDNPRFDRFLDGFTTQWLELDRLDILEIDKKQFPMFDEGVKSAAKKEPLAFFKYIFANNRPITDLIKSDYVVINETLAKFYGLEYSAGSGFSKVDLPTNSNRGGLLAQSAIMTLNTNGDRTSPVDRGAYIMKKFLDWGRLEPPPNVPELIVEKGGEPETVQDSLVAHSSLPQCMVCHQYIDPLGFGLENFNTVGLWRDYETLLVRKKGVRRAEKKEVPILAEGKIPNGKSFRGYKELQNALMTKQKSLARGLVKAMYTYALGRPINLFDEKVIDYIVDHVEKNKFEARSIIHAVVASKNFQIQ
jgi:hypothetical protein